MPVSIQEKLYGDVQHRLLQKYTNCLRMIKEQKEIPNFFLSTHFNSIMNNDVSQKNIKTISNSQDAKCTSDSQDYQ